MGRPVFALGANVAYLKAAKNHVSYGWPNAGYSGAMKVALLLVAAACASEKSAAPSAEQLHAKLAPVVEPKLQVIEKIAEEPLPAPTGKIELSGPPLVVVFDSGANEVSGNALYAFENDLRSIDRYQRNPLRYNFNGEIVNDCFMIVRKKMFAGGDFTTYNREPKTWEGEEHVVGMKLPSCAVLRYLIVVKLEAFKGTEYIDKEKFGGGGAIAQAHIFDIEAGGKYAGGVSFTAQSSSYVSGGNTDQDLRENFYKAMQGELRKHLPDARF